MDDSKVHGIAKGKVADKAREHLRAMAGNEDIPKGSPLDESPSPYMKARMREDQNDIDIRQWFADNGVDRESDHMPGYTPDAATPLSSVSQKHALGHDAGPKK